jgi:hypothetical protein
MFLWKNGKKLISHLLSGNDSMGYVSGFHCKARGRLHQKGALTIFEQLSKVARVDG